VARRREFGRVLLLLSPGVLDSALDWSPAPLLLALIHPSHLIVFVPSLIDEVCRRRKRRKPVPAGPRPCLPPS